MTTSSEPRHRWRTGISRPLLVVLIVVVAMAATPPAHSVAWDVASITSSYDGPTSSYDKSATIRAAELVSRVITLPNGESGFVYDPPRYRYATKGADDFVDLTRSQRRTHILYGDETGGGHLWPGQPGKTPFPQDWNADRVIHEISDVATDPLSVSATYGNRTVVTGVRDGVEIRVVVDNVTGEIVTGYPTNLPRNP